MGSAIYRKYRPKTFDQVYGQKHITETLKNQIKNHNIGHAYIFSGTRGTGKTSCAKIFSRVINCLNETDGNPCNHCENCLSILENTTMDVVEMDAASNRRIDDIRELRDKVIYPPSNLKYKVYIIDEAHMITNEGFNALLKIMEEPPEHLVFILATTELSKIPITIQSRCQKYEFRRLQIEDIIQNLKYIIDDLGIEMEESAIELIAKRAEGAMRDAQSTLDQVLSYDLKKITLQDIEEILGIVQSNQIFGVVDAICEKKFTRTIQTFEALSDGKAVEDVMKEILEHYRSLLLVKLSEEHQVEKKSYDLEQYKAQSSQMGLRQIIESINMLLKFEQDVKWTDNPQILAEMTILKLIDYINHDDLSARILTLEEKVAELFEKGISLQKNISEGSVKNIDTIEPKLSDTLQEEKRKEEKKSSDKDLEVAEPTLHYGSREIHDEEWQEFVKIPGIVLASTILESAEREIENNILKICPIEQYEQMASFLTGQDKLDIITQQAKKFFHVGKVEISCKKKDKKEEIDKKIKKLEDLFGEGVIEIIED